MKRLIVALALLAVGMLAWDRALQRREDESRAAGLRIAPLLSDADRAGRDVAALRVDVAGGESWLYAKVDGIWRCLSWKGAVADAAAVEQIVKAMSSARGMPISIDAAHPEAFGLDAPGMCTLSLLGAKFDPRDAGKDRLIALDLGRLVGVASHGVAGSGPVGAPELTGGSHAGLGAMFGGAKGSAGAALLAAAESRAFSFVRRHGSREIWSAELDVSALLERSAHPEEPPLLDHALLPAYWPGKSPRVKHMRIEREGRPSYDLVLHTRTVTAEQEMVGISPWQWVLRVDGHDAASAESVANHFSTFVQLAEWKEIVDPSLYPTLGFDKPRARLILQPPEGDPFLLQLGGHAPDGRPVVLDNVTGLIHEIDPALEALLFPELSAFAIVGAANGANAAGAPAPAGKDPWADIVDPPRSGDGPR